MRRPEGFSPSSFAMGAVALVAVAVLAGLQVTEGASVDAPAGTIINITGRKTGASSPRVVHTVPGGQELIIQGVAVVASDGQSVWVPAFDLKCGTTILLSRELLISTTGFDPVELGELGFVCGAGQQVKISGPDEVGATSIGWALLGQARNAG